MAKELKELIVEELTRHYTDIDRCVVVNFSGISAETTAEVRRLLREHNIDLHVVKNSLMARALTRVGLEQLVGFLSGPCAVVTGAGDVVELAKIITGVADRNRQLVIRGGLGEGQVLAASDIRRVASVPDKPTVISCFLRASRHPLVRMVGTLGTFTRNFVTVLDAIARKQGDGKEETGTSDEQHPGTRELATAAGPEGDEESEA